MALLLALLWSVCLGRPAAGQPELPSRSNAWEDARGLVPANFRKYETPRFLILSDADPRWARQQGARLERVHHQFMRWTRRMDLETAPLRHKLVCILFNDQDDYRTFARTVDGAGADWIAGYYAPNADRIVFYNVDGNAGIIEARRRIDEMQGEIRDLESQFRQAQRTDRLRQAALLRENLDQYEAHVEHERQRIDTFAASLDVATTVHESVHQLLFDTGVQSASAPYPVWISEGLACAFETDDLDRPFGPDHESAQRRAEFFEIMQQGALLDLRQLVQVMEIPDQDEDYVRRVYHQSYALVTWICRYRKSEFRRYLQLLKAAPSEARDGARQLDLVQQAFGDISKLERAWLRSERTALSEHRRQSLATADDH